MLGLDLGFDVRAKNRGYGPSIMDAYRRALALLTSVLPHPMYTNSLSTYIYIHIYIYIYICVISIEVY